jgi:maltose alpha-D-glucosyltransferase/alpha-amylase
MATSSSLLHWVRGMLQVRSRHPVFGLGDFQVCPSENEAILSFVRHHEGDRPVGTDAPASETVLCVNNLSSRPQATTVQLPEEYAGAQLVDLFGGQGFPKIGDDGKVLVTLGSRDFFWFQVRDDWARSRAGAGYSRIGERRG